MPSYESFNFNCLLAEANTAYINQIQGDASTVIVKVVNGRRGELPFTTMLEVLAKAKGMNLGVAQLALKPNSRWIDNPSFLLDVVTPTKVILKNPNLLSIANEALDILVADLNIHPQLYIDRIVQSLNAYASEVVQESGAMYGFNSNEIRNELLNKAETRFGESPTVYGIDLNGLHDLLNRDYQGELGSDSMEQIRTHFLTTYEGKPTVDIETVFHNKVSISLIDGEKIIIEPLLESDKGRTILYIEAFKITFPNSNRMNYEFYAASQDGVNKMLEDTVGYIDYIRDSNNHAAIDSAMIYALEKFKGCPSDKRVPRACLTYLDGFNIVPAASVICKSVVRWDRKDVAIQIEDDQFVSHIAYEDFSEETYKTALLKNIVVKVLDQHADGREIFQVDEIATVKQYQADDSMIELEALKSNFNEWIGDKTGLTRQDILQSMMIEGNLQNASLEQAQALLGDHKEIRRLFACREQSHVVEAVGARPNKLIKHFIMGFGDSGIEMNRSSSCESIFSRQLPLQRLINSAHHDSGFYEHQSQITAVYRNIEQAPSIQNIVSMSGGAAVVLPIKNTAKEAYLVKKNLDLAYVKLVDGIEEKYSRAEYDELDLQGRLDYSNAFIVALTEDKKSIALTKISGVRHEVEASRSTIRCLARVEAIRKAEQELLDDSNSTALTMN